MIVIRCGRDSAPSPPFWMNYSKRDLGPHLYNSRVGSLFYFFRSIPGRRGVLGTLWAIRPPPRGLLAWNPPTRTADCRTPPRQACNGVTSTFGTSTPREVGLPGWFQACSGPGGLGLRCPPITIIFSRPFDRASIHKECYPFRFDMGSA